MKEQEMKPVEIKYLPEFFVTDFVGLSITLKEKVRIMKDIEFSDIQKAQLAGILLGLSTTFQIFVTKLKEWGYGI